MKKQVVNLAMGVFSLGLICSCSSDEDGGGGGSSDSPLKSELNGTTWVCIKDTCSWIYDESKYNYTDTFDVETCTDAQSLAGRSSQKTLTFWEDGTCLNETFYSVGKEYGKWTISGDELKMVYTGWERESEEIVHTFCDEDTYKILSKTGDLMTMRYVYTEQIDDKGKKTTSYGTGEWKKVMSNTDELFGTWKCGEKSFTLKSDSSYSSQGMSYKFLGDYPNNKWQFTGRKILFTNSASHGITSLYISARGNDMIIGNRDFDSDMIFKKQ